MLNLAAVLKMAKASYRKRCKLNTVTSKIAKVNVFSAFSTDFPLLQNFIIKLNVFPLIIVDIHKLTREWQ